MGDGLEKKGLKGTWGYRGSSLFGWNGAKKGSLPWAVCDRN
jgi:hypothetical protein